MATTNSTNRLLNSHHAVMDAMAKSIVQGNSEEETFRLFQDTDTFNSVILNWKHPSLQINIFQLAIIYQRNLLVQFLGLRCPGFHNQRERYRFPDRTPEDTGVEILLNCPLHLACWVGSLEILKYLLINNTIISLNDVSVITLEKQIVNKKDITLFKRSVLPPSHGQKPFEVCVSEKHLNCTVYLMNNCVNAFQSFTYQYAGLEDQSSLLHKACSIGSGPLALLFLESLPETAIHLTDDTGKTPLHVAVLNGNSETIRYLLQHGTDPNIMWNTKSCLHIMYRSLLNIHRRVENTALLIEYGINVQTVDDAGNSALHILADQLQNNIFTTQMLRRAEYANGEDLMSSVSIHSMDYTLDMYYKDITECLHQLITNGADTTVKNSKGHTAFQILVEVTRFSSGLNEPQIYKAAEMLLDKQSPIIWSHFISTHLAHDTRRKDKVKLVTLLCQHGGDVDEQETTMDVFTGSCYPVFLAIRNRVDVLCVQLMLNYMSPSHLQDAVIMIRKSVLPQLRSRDPSDGYLEQLETLVGAVHLRTLRHLCKVAVLVKLRRRSERCTALPIPQFIKNYIMSAEF